MNRRFICTACGTKWFVHAHYADEPDLTDCGRCGGALARLDGGLRGDEPYGTLPGERTDDQDREA